MKQTAKVLGATLLLGVLALPALAQATSTTATPPAAPTDASGAYSLLNHPRALARFLDLSASQTATLLGLWKTLQTTVQPLRAAREPLCQQLRTDLGGTPNPTTVGTDTVALFENKGEIAAARDAFDTDFSAILNPTQLAMYDALKQLAHFADPEYNVIGNCPPPGA